MKIPKIILGFNPNNTGISVDFFEKADHNFAVHMQNFLYDIGNKYGGLPCTVRSKDSAECMINAELTRLVSLGLLKLDSDGTWYMEHIEDISNIGTDAVYKRHLNGQH